MKALLHDLLEEFHGKIAELGDLVLRDVAFPELRNKIKVAIGMRRTGKTSLLLQKIQTMLRDSPDLRDSILYLNFEDDRLLPLTPQMLGELLDSFYSLYPENHHKQCYFFLDEIQNVPQWETVIRRFFDTKKVEIYLTGSSAKLLSKEIATSLRGRSLATEVWPFSFREFLDAKGIEFPNKPLGKTVRDRLLLTLKQYIEQGGFPEIIGFDLFDRNRVLQDYVNTVIFRDIIERHKITNVQLMKYLIKTMLRQPGTAFSVNKFFNDLKTQGFNVGKTTVHEYLAHVEDAYLSFTVPLFSESIRKTHTNPRKIYAIDTGLVHAYTTSFLGNIGHHFENIVYLELRRRGYEVYYYLTEERYEIDFLARSPENRFYLFQVAWDVSDKETLAREERALKAAERELKISGEIITPESFLAWMQR
jgi:uncharacterized protein